MGKRIFMIAGEASGDLHGANLVKAIRKRFNGEVYGFGGSAMRKAGMEVLLDSSELAVVGITEVLSKLTSIRKGFRIAERLLSERRPDLLILIDFPDFNLRMAAKAKRLGISVLYYISPQIWAWRQGRVKTIRKIVDHVAVILPFEEAFYRNHGVPATFVGHPLLDEWELRGTSDERVAGRQPVVGLLPGSRASEIRRLLPVMLESASQVTSRLSGIRFIVSRSPDVEPAFFDSICSHYRGKIDFEIENGGARHIFRRVDLLIAASGTVTLEAAMAGTPMVVIYKVSPLSFVIGRLLIRVPHIALVNLIAGKRVVPELIQHQASPKQIASEMTRWIEDHGRRQVMRKELFKAAGKLGSPGASERVATLALDIISDFKGVG